MNKNQTGKLLRIVESIVDKKLIRRQLTESKDKFTDTFNQIDWNNVGLEILKAFKIKTSLDFKHKGKYVEMISDDISKQCGIFQYAIGECHLTFFSNSLKPDNDTIFWASISLSYPGNGMSIGNIWVKSNGEVIIQKDTPRKTSRNSFD
jgi:hypothetical protein